ncbi:hypothetical protein DNTS_008415 [Danionella cerebrum]|uniref:SET domain-containing protein n=1 Tax=Danionella cerebrum TaxID=2873325 RepID=A0A553MTU0_9TELE|nr:hypothetical protein DNTS_008415 [Danionella translucida]
MFTILFLISLANSAMPRRTTPLQDAINHILTERDKNSMLEIKHINPVKGRGIFALADFSQGEFVVEYRGELIDAAEAENRRKLYENACLFFMFDFTWKQKTWCQLLIPLTVTSTAAQELIKDCFQDQVITSTESTEESRIQSCNITSSSPASKLSGASLPSGQLSELGDKDPDLDPNVLATDLLRGTELRAECQSSSSTLDGPEHEVHCGRGQCAALPAKEGFEEVGIQSQEVFPAVFSTDITSETELRSECHSSRAVSTSSACECTIHKLVFEVVRMDKCWICKSPVASVRWRGVRCKQCCGVWHKICLKKSSEDWDISDDDVSSGDEFIPESVTDSESSETELTTLPESYKKSRTTKILDLCVPYAEQEQTLDIQSNCKNILTVQKTTDVLQSDPEPESPVSCKQTAKAAKNGENFAALTLASPHLSETAAQDTHVSSRRCVKRPWSEEEIHAVMKHMRPFIENGVTVTNGQCLNCKEKEPHVLEKRTIQNIRDFVRNRGLAFKKHSNAKR